jgi:alkylated DNA repair dioxygenase AlkB
MIELAPGLIYHPDYLDRAAQEQLLTHVRDITREAPLFTPRMPRTGKAFSVRMTNCGRLGWVSDQERGYRYQATHPDTGAAWPPFPRELLPHGRISAATRLRRSAAGLSASIASCQAHRRCSPKAADSI